MRVPPALIVVAGLAGGVILLHATATRSTGNPDYTLHLPHTTTYTGSCPAQSLAWYKHTGQTDMTALAAATQSVLDVQMQGGVVSALQHASQLLSQSAANAAGDPMPACADTARAWPAMTRANKQAGLDLFLTDVTGAAGQLDSASMDLRIVKAELPGSWYPPKPAPRKPRVIRRTVYVQAPVAVAATTSTTQTGAPVRAGSTSTATPDRSCPVLGATAVYYTPARHTRDDLTCQLHTTASGTRQEWRITGHN